MLKRRKQNNEASQAPSSVEKMKHSIRWQAGLAIMTLVLTGVLVFSMTAAWYTNVTQTSGLIIQTESWGFEGQIQVSNATVEAGPGDEGTVGLRVSNTDETQSAVSIGVSKARMDSAMQQRLYFYVDVPMTRNSELMERVYLNTNQSYTYTLFAGEALELSQQRHTDAPVKWHWVYDVLGYYVLGRWSPEESKLYALDYLRPIEYDYDQATTTFTQVGDALALELETVDGMTSVEEFLVELSRTDGYPGQIDPTAKLGSGYYPVAVDENGYGVFAYLCTYAEIQQATAYDTALAQTAKDAHQTGNPAPSYEAVIQISAQQSQEQIVSVSSLSAVQELLAQGSQAVAQLTNDLVLTSQESLILPQGSRLTLDLNGHTITTAAEGKAIYALPGSQLMLRNGKITGTADYGLYAVGSKVLCHQLELEGFRYGLYLGDSDLDNRVDSLVRLVDCDFSATDYTVFVSGNGTGSAQKTQLVVDNCRLTSGGMVICSNGSTTGQGRWGTDIQVLNSTLTANPAALSTAIYHPQKDSTLTVYNSTLSGYTGMVIKGGQVSVQGSSVMGAGPKQDPIPSGSGFADTGDGIYIETNYGYEISLEISGSNVTQSGETRYREAVITSAQGYSLQVDQPNAPHVKVCIHSGQFDQPQRGVDLAAGATQREENGKYLVVK